MQELILGPTPLILLRMAAWFKANPSAYSKRGGYNSAFVFHQPHYRVLLMIQQPCSPDSGSKTVTSALLPLVHHGNQHSAGCHKALLRVNHRSK
jgi:hypothetical protein